MDIRDNLYNSLQREVMCSEKPFSWSKTIHRAIKCPERRYNFWWRLASYHFKVGGKFRRKIACRIGYALRNKYGLDIGLAANIGPGLKIAHYVGIVITGYSVIGENFYIRQNVTVGVKRNDQNGIVFIGDNVEVGANSCIIGDDIKIGNNVTIGAMTFVNKDIPDNSVVFTERTNRVAPKMNA